MTAFTLVSRINHYHINGLHQFWDTLYKIVLFMSLLIQDRVLFTRVSLVWDKARSIKLNENNGLLI